MKSSILPLLLWLVISCNTPQNKAYTILPHSDPLTLGLDSTEINEIEAHIKWAIDSAYISGAVALIAVQDQIIYHEAFGYSDREKTKRMSTDNIFRFASMTKPIVSTAIMQLVEQGKISVEDPVEKFIPELGDVEVLDVFNAEDSTFTTKPLERSISIHHLLTHTSGIPYPLFDPRAAVMYAGLNFTEAWTKDSVVLATNIPKLAKAPLMHQPGESWTYGTSIDVLGRIVEVVSGMALDEYLNEYIFNPLEMPDTRFYLPEEQADRLVDVWFTADVSDEMKPLLGTDYSVSGAQTYFSGGGGLVGTSMDYLKYASAMLNNGSLGDAKILDPATVQTMFQNQIDTLRLGPDSGFGYGGMVRLNEDPTGLNAGYWGWGGFWQTIFGIDPQNDLVVILLTNAYTTPKSNELLNGYEKLVVQAIEN